MKNDKWGNDIAWAYSLNTVLLIGDALYGATVLGGNILKTEINGATTIVWKNDCTNPYDGGIFIHSLFYGDKLYFFPYRFEYIVIYNINDNSVEKLYFEDKGSEEKIYSRLFENRIIMFGLDTGRVWEL